MREGGATPHTEGMPRAEGSWPLEGEQLGRAPLPTAPLSQEHRSGAAHGHSDSGASREPFPSGDGSP